MAKNDPKPKTVEEVEAEYQEALDNAVTENAELKSDLEQEKARANLLRDQLAEANAKLEEAPAPVVSDAELVEQIQAQQEMIEEQSKLIEQLTAELSHVEKPDAATMARRKVDAEQAEKTPVKYCKGLFCEMPVDDFDAGSDYSNTFKAQKAKPVPATASPRRPEQNRIVPQPK